MYSQKEIEMLRALSEAALRRAEKSIVLLGADSITPNSFDAVTLDMAARLNGLSRLYAIFADIAGTARMDCRDSVPPLTPEVFEFLLH